ncbi:MAG: hypothetical protein AAFX54_14345 [Pseudomonadota bacterium]
MSEERNDIDAPEDDASKSDDGAKPRVRFQGIVEAGSREATLESGDFGLVAPPRDERRWNAMSRQVWLVSWLTALFVFFSIVVGTPLGNYFAHIEIYGSMDGWNPFKAYSANLLLLSVIIPVLAMLAGYILSKALTMMNAAESIAAAAQQFTTPDVTAVKNADTVGEVMRGHMTALNEGLDGALTRLASVEAMIRQHVEAIEIAGEAIEHKATGAVERVADERSRLMDLTESLNAHADSFAAAIAERANSSIEALQSADTISVRAENEFDERLSRLEDAAARALTSFESLRDALRDSDGTMRETAQSIDEAAQHTLKATEQAKAASNAAAESAALNAANVAASASRASQAAKEAADAAIETATREAERMTREAVDAAKREGEKVQEATKETLGDLFSASRESIDAAAEDIAKATKAAAEASEAAQKTSEAAGKAAADVTAASEQARKTSEEAIEYTKTAKTHIDDRNKALADARAALEKENARLETLIEEQRSRADRLADAISSQTERLSRLAEAQLQEQEAAAKLAEAQQEAEARAAQEAEEKAKKEAEQKAKAEAAQEAARKAADKKRAEEEAAKAKSAPRRKRKEPPADAQTNGAARLEEIARDIAARKPQKSGPRRTEPPLSLASNAAEAPAKRGKADVSWREILDAADDAEPLELGEVAKNGPTASPRDDAENAIKTISRLQHFTYDLETRLYGDPPPALQERFDRGDRNVFANRLLRLNEADVKRRIRTESGRDRDFERGIHDFLQGFERLLEDATTSETADEELEEYLSSPLGRVYLLIGATVGYFA